MDRRPTVSRLGSYVNPGGIQQAPPRNLNDRIFGCAEFKTNFFRVRGTGVSGIAGHGDSFAGFDGVGCPADVGEIQPTHEFYGPLADLTGRVGDTVMSI